MKNISIYILPIVLSVIVSIGTMTILDSVFSNNELKIFNVEPTPVPTPLAKYSIKSLSEADIKHSNIEIGDIIDERKESSTYAFKLIFDPTLNNEDDKTVTGTINIPNENKKYPLVILIRGYVDKEIYSPGLGARNAGIYFANNDFITVAPDFLGYGDSDTESFNIFEARFQTHTTILSILNSLDSLKNWDRKNIFIWAHSNGGQIALTTLAVTGDKIPTALWAPVSKPFPYSILYFTDELEDQGKYLRKELAKFEEVYNTDDYSFTNYLDKIKAPIYIHQGADDDSVPVEWSRELDEELNDIENEHKLFIYPLADHNMQPNWNEAIKSDLDFFIDNMK